jgi:hypothetical protein
VGHDCFSPLFVRRDGGSWSLLTFDQALRE